MHQRYSTTRRFQVLSCSSSFLRNSCRDSLYFRTGSSFVLSCSSHRRRRSGEVGSASSEKIEAYGEGEMTFCGCLSYSSADFVGGGDVKLGELWFASCCPADAAGLSRSTDSTVALLPESDWRDFSRGTEIRGGAAICCCCDCCCCLANHARDPLFGTGNDPEDSGRSMSHAEVAGPASGVCIAPAAFAAVSSVGKPASAAVSSCASSERLRCEDVEESPMVEVVR